MRVSAEIKEMPGIEQAFAFMATEINKKTRMQESLMGNDVLAAGSDDLVLLVEADNEASGQEALEQFEKKISSSTASLQKDNSGNYSEALPTTFEQGKAYIDANLAVISVPGPYAAVQAMTALSQNMNVLLFSDNVSIEEEITIKDFAAKKGLIVMGPDCGTAIINGVPLCFANVVKRGKIGVIGASGTGMQELTVLLDSAGCGIAHAIGTGGRDLSKEVAGRTALSALKLLEQDPNTEIIAIISKPPAQSVADKVIEAVKAIGKPAVLAFLGATTNKIADNIYIAGTIEEAAAKITAIHKGNNPEETTVLYERKPIDNILVEASKLITSQKTIKGLYTGGTLASEAKHILVGLNADVIDLGDDEYTRGALHPMIDPTKRGQFVMQAFSDDTIGVVLCDVVIGYGSHPDPAFELAKDIKAAREKYGLHKIVIASVTGTENDPQVKSVQIKKLEDAGIFVFSSNQYAAEVAKSLSESIA